MTFVFANGSLFCTSFGEVLNFIQKGIKVPVVSNVPQHFVVLDRPKSFL